MICMRFFGRSDTDKFLEEMHEKYGFNYTKNHDIIRVYETSPSNVHCEIIGSDVLVHSSSPKKNEIEDLAKKYKLTVV